MEDYLRMNQPMNGDQAQSTGGKLHDAPEHTCP